MQVRSSHAFTTSFTKETFLEKLLVLDYGSQYTQLIVRRVRECGVYAEVKPFSASIDDIRSFAPKAIILSGGPASVYDGESPRLNEKIFDLSIPILGICYGMQLLNTHFYGEVRSAGKREFGKATLITRPNSVLDRNIVGGTTGVWMSHGDEVTRLAPCFQIDARTSTCAYAAISHTTLPYYGVQFHPEVTHTEQGKNIILGYLKEFGFSLSWSSQEFINTTIQAIKTEVGDGKVLCALSGGVDSAVTAAIVRKAIGDRLECVFVDNGLLRKGERDDVCSNASRIHGDHFTCVDASEEFISALSGVTDPETKRKIIGRTFIEVFDKAIKENPERYASTTHLAQGTLYPDVIESVSHKGPSAVIKSHHNVGGLPERMSLKLLEPLRLMFKDEVRQVGRDLGMDEAMINRMPFPGPGLSIRILGDVDPSKLEVLREADYIVRQEVGRSKKYDEIWQAFAVLLPIKTVGVMGDARTYDNVCAIRIVKSDDGMTASVPFYPDILEKISSRIVNEVKGINRVVYDITSKPPGTIEWE